MVSYSTLCSRYSKRNEVKEMTIKRYFLIGWIIAIALSQFLGIDSTDTHRYINGTYVCKDFSTDIIWNASNYQLYLDFIYIPEYNHMMVGMYDPLTETITIIEPQNDQIISTIKDNDEQYVRIKVWHERQYWYNIGRVN